MESLLTSAEAAEYLKVSPNTLAKWRSCGGGPAYVKVGDLVRYSRDSIKRLNAERVRVEPKIGRTLREMRITRNIRTVIRTKPQNRPARVAVIQIRQQCHREWATGLKRQNAKCLSASQHRIQPCLIEVPRWQVVQITERRCRKSK